MAGVLTLGVIAWEHYVHGLVLGVDHGEGVKSDCSTSDAIAPSPSLRSAEIL